MACYYKNKDALISFMLAYKYLYSSESQTPKFTSMIIIWSVTEAKKVIY